MNSSSFSVIIPSYNEAAHIRQCIEGVKANANELVTVEILVVDNGSTDGTIEIVKKLNVKIIENTEGKRKSISTLRNVGARAAQNNILVFLDADMIVPENWLHKAKEYFRSAFEGALGFIENVPSSAGWVGKTWGNRLSLKRDRVMDVDFLPGRNILVNRHVFEKVGGFDNALSPTEDKDFTFRVLQAGFRAVSVPDVVLVHLGYDRSIWEFLRKEFWRQDNALKFARKQGFSLRTLRHPMLSAWHILFLFGVIFAALMHVTDWLATLALLWILPSAIIALVEVGLKRPAGVLPLFVLTWLRWHAAGFALLREIFRGEPLKRG